MEAIGLAADEKGAARFFSADVVRRVCGPRRDRPAQAGPDVQRKPPQWTVARPGDGSQAQSRNRISDRRWVSGSRTVNIAPVDGSGSAVITPP
jgi:hypothetical protein